MKNESNPNTTLRSKPTRTERRAKKTQNRILEAAKELFENYPYEDVKIDDIAERADIGRATIYYHYTSKEAIFFEIGIHSFREISKRQQALIATKSTGLEQILKLSEDTLQSLFETPLMHEIMRQYLVLNSKAEIPAAEILKKLESGESVENSALIRARYLREIRRFEKPWISVMVQGFEDGSIHHDLNPDQLLHFLFLIISGIVDRAHLERIPLQTVGLSSQQIISQTIDLIRKDISNG